MWSQNERKPKVFPVKALTLSLSSFFEYGKKGGLFVLYGDAEVNSLAQRLLSRFVSCGYNVMVLDAGNLFDPYLISRTAQALGREPREFLSKIVVSRSFTCHQTHALVRKVARLNGNAARIIFIPGLLTTFYDEEVPLGERKALLKKTLVLLKEISPKGVNILATSKDPPVRVRDGFQSLLIDVADRAARVDVNDDGSLWLNSVKGVTEMTVLKR